MQIILKPIRFISVIVLLLATILFSLNTQAQDNKYRKILDLSDNWKFSIGDNKNWSSVGFDDSNWESIRVPDKWEDQGFFGYDGYAWYRTSFLLDIKNSKTPLYLSLGYIDDVDEVFINGKSIGKTGSFPPNYSTAYNARRIYRIPVELLNSGTKNTIAVRIFDEGGEGGIIQGKIAILIDIEAIPVDVNFQGIWKFKTGNCDISDNMDFNISNWANITVPDMWENQGYKNYDGYACYALEFNLNDQYKNDRMVLVLGKIDDFDQVYINGKLVGQSADFSKNSLIQYSDFSKQMRGYYLPENVLIPNSRNILLVKVLDTGGIGGIYEGSVGLITQTNYIKYWRSRRNKYVN